MRWTGLKHGGAAEMSIVGEGCVLVDLWRKFASCAGFGCWGRGECKQVKHVSRWGRV